MFTSAIFLAYRPERFNFLYEKGFSASFWALFAKANTQILWLNSLFAIWM
jgi:hypothetical protein